MKKILTYSFLIISMILYAQEEHIKTFSEEYEHFKFKPNENISVFGNNVRLRSDTNTDSKIIETLSIGEKVTILEITNQMDDYNNIQWEWYKVKYKNKTGYILGALLSRQTYSLEEAQSTYVTSFSKANQNEFLIIRHITNADNESFVEYQIPLENSDIGSLNFELIVYFFCDIPKVEEAIYVDFIALDEGVEDGGIYLFNTGEKIVKAIELSEGGGENYSDREKVILPMDEGGDKDGLIIIKTEYKNLEYGKNYEKESYEKETFRVKWEGKEIILKELRKNYE